MNTTISTEPAEIDYLKIALAGNKAGFKAQKIQGGTYSQTVTENPYPDYPDAWVNAASEELPTPELVKEFILRQSQPVRFSMAAAAKIEAYLCAMNQNAEANAPEPDDPLVQPSSHQPKP